MTPTRKNDLRGYAFIRNQIVHQGVAPSLREIADAVGYSSRHSAEKLLRRLEEEGLIKKVATGIQLAGRAPSMSEETIEVPLVGAAACGLPTLAEQDYEAVIPVSTRLARPGHTYFLLRAKGPSMNKSGINDGDLVLVRQQSDAAENEKVVALINDEATIKHFHREGNIVALKPNSTDKRYQHPIFVSDEFMIQGVVVATLPKKLY